MASCNLRLIGIFIALLAGCSEDAGEAGSDGQPGTDGQPGVDGRDGADGRQGARGDAGPRGATGPAGTSCTVTNSGDGVNRVSCEDGTSVTVRDGMDGEDGDAGSDGLGGEKGADGQDGASCTLIVNANDTSTLTCGSDQVTFETPLCGNGQVARTEECDDAGESATCTAGCTRMYEYAVLGNHYGDLKVLDLTARTWRTFDDAAYGSNGGGDVRHDGMLMFADYVFSGVHQIDPATGARSSFITGLGSPDDVEQASTGDIYVEDGNTVARYDSSGVFQANISIAFGEADPKLAAGPNGEVYFFRSGCPGSSTPPFCDNPDDAHTGEIFRLDSGTAVLVTSCKAWRASRSTPRARSGRPPRRVPFSITK